MRHTDSLRLNCWQNCFLLAIMNMNWPNIFIGCPSSLLYSCWCEDSQHIWRYQSLFVLPSAGGFGTINLTWSLSNSFSNHGPQESNLNTKKLFLFLFFYMWSLFLHYLKLSIVIGLFTSCLVPHHRSTWQNARISQCFWPPAWWVVQWTDACKLWNKDHLSVAYSKANNAEIPWLTTIFRL